MVPTVADFAVLGALDAFSRPVGENVLLASHSSPLTPGLQGEERKLSLHHAWRRNQRPASERAGSEGSVLDDGHACGLCYAGAFRPRVHSSGGILALSCRRPLLTRASPHESRGPCGSRDAEPQHAPVPLASSLGACVWSCRGSTEGTTRACTSYTAVRERSSAASPLPSGAEPLRRNASLLSAAIGLQSEIFLCGSELPISRRAGTVAAAREAANIGVPAIAVSLDTFDRAADYKPAVSVVVRSGLALRQSPQRRCGRAATSWPALLFRCSPSQLLERLSPSGCARSRLARIRRPRVHPRIRPQRQHPQPQEGGHARLPRHPPGAPNISGPKPQPQNRRVPRETRPA